MPGLPPGAGMYYDVGPKPDGRHMRALVKTLAKELDHFLELHAKAKKANDAGLFQKANKARSQIEVARLSVTDQKAVFPRALQEKLELAIGKVTTSLEEHPAFPEALSNNLNPEALPNFINRIQRRASSVLNAPINLKGLPSYAIRQTPASEAEVHRKAFQDSHSIARVGMGASNYPNDVAPSIAPSLVASTERQPPREPNGGPTEPATHSHDQPDTNQLHQRPPSIISIPQNFFPTVPGVEITEEHVQLQRRYDEILARKQQLETQYKEQREGFHAECKTLLDQMHGLKTTDGDDDDEEDALDPLRAVIDQDEKRRQTDIWVQSVSSEHSPDKSTKKQKTNPRLNNNTSDRPITAPIQPPPSYPVVMGESPPRPSHLNAAKEVALHQQLNPPNLPTNHPDNPFQSMLDKAQPVQTLAPTTNPDPRTIQHPTQNVSGSIPQLKSLNSMNPHSNQITDQRNRSSQIISQQPSQPLVPPPGFTTQTSDYTFKIPATPVFNQPRHHRELERSLLKDHSAVKPKSHVSRPLNPITHDQNTPRNYQNQMPAYTLFNNPNPFQPNSRVQFHDYKPQMPSNYHQENQNHQSFNPKQVVEDEGSYAHKVASGTNVINKNHGEPSSTPTMCHRTTEVPNRADGGRTGDPRVQVDLNPDDNNSASQKLLILTAELTSGQYLSSNRFEKEERFTGNEETDKHDLESVINRFEFVTTQPGVTEKQRKMELQHYFSGEAKKILRLYDNNPDPNESVRLTIQHLRKEFGRTDDSATKMLEKILKGGDIDKNSWEEMAKVRLDLQGQYQTAKETGRDATFNTAETIDKIIQTKLSFLAFRWCTEKNRPNHNSNKPPFELFLDFLFEQNKIRRDMNSLLGYKEKKKGENYAIDAVDFDDENESPSRGAVSNSRRGGKSAAIRPNNTAVINATNTGDEWTMVNYRKNGNHRANNTRNNSFNAANNHNGSSNNNFGVTNYNPGNANHRFNAANNYQGAINNNANAINNPLSAANSNFDAAQNNASAFNNNSGVETNTPRNSNDTNNNQNNIDAQGGSWNNYRAPNFRRQNNNYRNDFYPRNGFNYNNYANRPNNNGERNNNHFNNNGERNNNHFNNNGRNNTRLDDRLLSLANTGGEAKNAIQPGDNKTASSNANEGETVWRCPCCCSTTLHALNDCATYINKGYEDRFQTAITLNRCLNCLTFGHTAKFCRIAPQCKLCHGPHHTLLHKAPRDEDNNEKPGVNA